MHKSLAAAAGAATPSASPRQPCSVRESSTRLPRSTLTRTLTRDGASSSAAACPPSPSPTLQAHSEPPAGLRRRQLLLLLGTAAAVSLGPQADALAAVGPRTDQPVGLEGNVFLMTSSESENLTLAERQVLNLNLKVQTQNRVPKDFPSFIRAGFDVKVIAPGFSMTPEGIIYRDFKEGTGSTPEDSQEVVFNYNGFNESGTPIDSSYRQNRPAQSQLGTGGLIPGFEMALRSMKVGTQRRFIVPPALGPPVGPSTFFSAKQCEVFDVELLAIRTCTRRQSLMLSSVVCE